MSIPDQGSGYFVTGNNKRHIIVWRTPAHGYVQMYVNPQSVVVADKKIFTTARTKAGFVYQYAGEDLTQITISGTTGSSGVQGINVLESIYRSEQEGFRGVAQGLDQTVAVKRFGGALDNLFAGAANSISPALGASITQAAHTLNVYSQPLPSLASLAVAVEMTFQRVTYRGFFSSFSVTESANSPGLFDYTIGFTAYAKLGVRTNFMPWHRRGDVVADSNDDGLLTFAGGGPGSAGGLSVSPPTQAARFANDGRSGVSDDEDL